MSTKVPLQALHARRLALLIQYAHELGYLVTGGDWYRDRRCPYGQERSAHHDRLATDLNLFRVEVDLYGEERYVYLTRSEDYQELGEFWERLGGHWGVVRDGRQVDGNHFETV